MNCGKCCLYYYYDRSFSEVPVVFTRLERGKFAFQCGYTKNYTVILLH